MQAGDEILDQRSNMGLIHRDTAHKRPVENREALTACAEEAARRGARIIPTPEPAVSGYGSDGRDHAASRVEVLHGTTARTAGPWVRTLVLWLTTRCNLRCAYCYRGEQREMAMPLEVIRSALQQAGGAGCPLHVQMAGGEPTLELDLVEAVGRMVRRGSPSASLAVQTNGTLVDDRFVELCRRYDISVGVSVDGPPGVQERIRGGAAATFRGLALLARHHIPVNVTTVLSSANAAHLGELILTLSAFPNVRGVGLDPVVEKGAALSLENPVPSPDLLVSGVNGMLFTWMKVNTLRTVPIRWREWEAVSRAWNGGGNVKPFCHACTGESLAVCPDGTVYPCSQSAMDPAMAVGTVDRVDWDKLRGMYSGVTLRGNCGSCPLEGRCPGDCPSRITRNGTREPSPMCLIYQTIVSHLQEMKGHEQL